MNPILAGPQGIHCGSLILVNAQHPVQLQTAERCVPLPGSGVLLQQRAAAVLQHMLVSLGCTSQIVPVSGYRRLAEQQQIWDDAMREHGEAFTRQYVALPGCSEHQTGLAIDLGLNQGEIDFIRPAFPYEGICQRFREAAPQYGFVERYPAGKEPVTGIAHECWHFRYVGAPAEKAGRHRLPDSSLYEISGNNVDGYIVTLWRQPA